MTVMSTGCARIRRVAAVAVLALAACGTSSPSSGPNDAAAPPAATATDTAPDTAPAPDTTTRLETSPPTTAPIEPLPPIEIVAALGYPRDLLERGRVNLNITREGNEDFVVFEKRLVADFFVPAPTEARRSVLPPDGRLVALQTLFGEVDDCRNPDPVTAVVEFTFIYGDDPTLRTEAVPVTDATTLDSIRLQKCTVIEVLADNSIELANPVVDGETMTADLVITRAKGRRHLSIDSIKGTVLFGAATAFEPGSPERTIEPDQPGITIPLVFDVNRCDSHAVAETTRKYGLDIYVAVDGAESQRIDVPIDSIRSQLETMLDRCTARTGQ